MQLINTLKSGVSTVLVEDNLDSKIILMEMSRGLTIDKVIAAPTMKTTISRIGEDNLLKMLIVAIKTFHDTVRGGEKTNPVEIIAIANRIMDTYPHESFKDVLMAFNKAVVSGRKFYGGVSASEVFDIINFHLEEKAEYREHQHAIEKGKHLQESKGVGVPYAKEILAYLEKKTGEIKAKQQSAIEPRLYKLDPLTAKENEARLNEIYLENIERLKMLKEKPIKEVEE